MSYPKNAATPPRIAVGAVVQISDGAVQTSGVSIRVVPQGGSAAAGLGTTTYEDGVVLYAPTQAETNYDAVVVIAYKTGCIPATTTIVTSASATAGYGGLDFGKIISASATVNLSGTTVKTATDIETDTQDIQSRLPAALVSGRMDASVGAAANNSITAASLAADASSEIAAAVRTELATELGRIDATIGSRSSHTASDVWQVGTRTLTAFSFSVTVGTNNDKTGYSLVTAPLDASGTAAAVWDAVMASYTTAGTFGGRIVRSTNSNNSVAITGSNHVAAVIHDLQPAVIQATHFSLGAVDANALAADAAAEIASAVRTNLATELGRIDAATSTRAMPADIPSAITIADAVLSRSVATVEGSAAEHTLCTLVLAALEGAISSNTWTIKRSNGSTTHYTKTVTADANASPIVGVQ